MTNDRLTTAQAAAYLGIKPSTLEVWRSTGRYPLPFQKVGNRVFYARGALDAFVENRTFYTTSGARDAA